MRRKTPADFGPPTYKVGKGRPPAKSRWRPGQSGNPTGRPKGSKNLDTILTEILNGKIKYTTKSGKERTISVRDLQSADYLLARDAEIARKNPPAPERSKEPTDPKERERWAQQSYLKLIRG